MTVKTPVLPAPLTGTAWLVSHGGAQFPDLDLVLTGDDLEVVLVGHTHIARSSITTSTFETLPDVPITSVTVNLPTAANSALAPNGLLCGTPLIAPTTAHRPERHQARAENQDRGERLSAAAAVPQAPPGTPEAASMGPQSGTREHHHAGREGDPHTGAR